MNKVPKKRVASSQLASRSPKKLSQRSLLDGFLLGQAECKYCGMRIDRSALVQHEIVCKASCVETKFVATVLSQESSSVPMATEKNAFEVLMAAKPKEAECSWVFALVQNEGKISAKIFHEGSGGQAWLWSSKVSIRNFPCKLGYGSNGESELETLPFKICTNIKQLDIVASAFDSPLRLFLPQEVTTSPFTNSLAQQISVVKSMFQKAIRRKKALSAAKLGLKLYRLSPIDFLRRFPIIILEDCSLHPAFPIAVWLMIAFSKGFVPPNWLIGVLLHIVVDISISSHKDLFPDHSSEEEERGVAAWSVRPLELPVGTARTLIVSLLLRASYGGMDCDVSLMRTAAIAWTIRYFRNTLDERDSDSNVSSKLPLSLALSLSDISSVYNNTRCSCYLDFEYVQSLILSCDSRSLADGLRYSWGLLCILAFACPDAYISLPWMQALMEHVDYSSAAVSSTSASCQQSSRFLSLFAKHIEIESAKQLPELILLEELKIFILSEAGAAGALPDWSCATLAFNLQLFEDDLVLEGIDFHCCSDMVAAIYTQQPHRILECTAAYSSLGHKDAEELLRTAIWTCSSGVNFRTYLWAGVLTDSKALKTFNEQCRMVIESKKTYGKIWSIVCPLVKLFAIEKCKKLSTLLCSTAQPTGSCSM